MYHILTITHNISWRVALVTVTKVEAQCFGPYHGNLITSLLRTVTRALALLLISIY